MYRFVCVILLTASALAAAKHRVLFNRYRVPETALFIADANGATLASQPPALQDSDGPQS